MSLKVAIYSGVVPSTPFIENLIKSLRKKEIEIYLYGRKKISSKYQVKNIRLFLIPENRLFRLIFFIRNFLQLLFFKPLYLLKLLKYYNKRLINNKNLIPWLIKVFPLINNKPDIFHIQWAKSLSFWYFLKEIFEIKIIVSLRGAHINYSPLVDKKLALNYKKLFPKVNAFHAVSNAIAVESLKYGANQKNIKVIYSGIDISLIKSLEKKEVINEGMFKFISVGRHHWKKGYDSSISAFKKLLKDHNNIEYQIIALNKPSEEILYLIDDLGIKKNIILKSLTSQKEVYKEMLRSDCLILPSVEEGIANVVLESMSLGLPVISSDCGGMKKVIKNNYNGFNFRSRDVDQLKIIMEKMIYLPKIKRNKLIKNAKIEIEERFGLERLGEEMKNLYLSLDHC